MARDRDIDLTISARDDASDELDRVAGKVDALPDSATVDVDADTADASRDLDDVAGDVDRLDGDTAVVDVDADTADARGAFDELGDKLADLDAGASNLGGRFTGLASRAGPAAGLVGLLGLAVDRTIDVGTEVGTIASTLGTSTDEASRLRAVFGDVGIEADELIDIALQVGDAIEGDAELAEKLGLRIEDASDPARVLREAVDRWDFLTPTQRARAFGEEGQRQIGRLIASGEDLDDLLANVDPGRILDDEEVDNAIGLADGLRDATGWAESLALEIGGPVVDALNTASDAIAEIPGQDSLGDLITDTLVDVLLGAGTSAKREAERQAGDVGNAWARGVADVVSRRVPRAFDTAERASARAGRNMERDAKKAERASADYFAELARLDGRFDNVGGSANRAFTRAKTAAEDAEDAASTYRRVVNGLNRRLSEIDLTRAFDDAEAAAEAAGKASEAAGDDVEQLGLDAEEAFIDAALKVADYIAQLDNIPDSVKTELTASLDYGSQITLDQLRAFQDNLERGISIPLTPYWTTDPNYYAGLMPQGGPRSAPGGARDATGDELAALSTGIVPTITSPMLPPLAMPIGTGDTVNVTVNMPPGADGRDVVAAVDRWRRRNGR